MKQIRTGVFETNSSSVHSICISKNTEIEPHSEIYFAFGDYGWQEDTLDSCHERAAYLWTSIIECYGWREEFIPKIEEIKIKITEMLNSEGIECDFAKYEIKTSSYDNKKYCEIDGYVDHGSETTGFIQAVINDKNKLLHYLFSPESVVYTGNDNTDWNPQTFGVADEYCNDENYHTISNPYHDETKYEYFCKGN